MFTISTYVHHYLCSFLYFCQFPPFTDAFAAHPLLLLYMWKIMFPSNCDIYLHSVVCSVQNCSMLCSLVSSYSFHYRLVYYLSFLSIGRVDSFFFFLTITLSNSQQFEPLSLNIEVHTRKASLIVLFFWTQSASIKVTEECMSSS